LASVSCRRRAANGIAEFRPHPLPLPLRGGERGWAPLKGGERGWAPLEGRGERMGSLEGRGERMGTF